MVLLINTLLKKQRLTFTNGRATKPFTLVFMCKIVAIHFALLLVCPVKTNAQNIQAEQLLHSAYKKVQGINSGHIEFLFNAKKRLDIDTREKDTITKYGFFDFAYKDENNSIAAYVLSIEGIKTYLYFNDTCYTINLDDNSIKKEHRTKRLLWPLSVNGLTLVEATVQGGERIDKLKERTTDTGYFTTFLADSILNNNQECYTIQILKNDSDIDEKELYTPSYHKKLYIAKADSTLLKEYHTHIDFGFRFYWNEQITRYKLNHFTTNEVEKKAESILKDFEANGFTYFEEEPPILNDNTYTRPPPKVILQEGIILPNWKLPLYAKEVDSVELYSINAQYILLDFWYASCAPCLQDIPKIKSYRTMYDSTELAVFGINVYDKDTSRIRAIDDRYHFNYPILINGRELAEEDYGQKAFPLKVLLDNKKKIIYIGKGHSLKEGPTELDLLLKKLLGH